MKKYQPDTPLLRRKLLLGVAATAGAVGADRLGMPFISRGLANTPVKIGVILATTGPMSAEAEAIKHGAEEALILQGRKAMGRPVELVFMDEPDEAGAVANMKKLITEHKVAAISGGTAAGPALAMAKAAAEAKIPYIVHTAMYDEITGKDCNAWTFRVPAPFDVQYHAIAPYLTGYGKK